MFQYTDYAISLHGGRSVAFGFLKFLRHWWWKCIHVNSAATKADFYEVYFRALKRNLGTELVCADEILSPFKWQPTASHWVFVCFRWKFLFIIFWYNWFARYSAGNTGDQAQDLLAVETALPSKALCYIWLRDLALTYMHLFLI